MTDSNESIAEPSLLERRWKEIKTAMYYLADGHDRHELLLNLLRQREEFTEAPTLGGITNFTGFDVAIKTIQGWDWQVRDTGRSVEIDAAEIGRYGAELMVVHTLRESIKNDLLEWDGKELSETHKGAVHFDALNSFNVDITGSRMDIARKRFLQSRLTKKQRKMDPVNKIPLVKHLYWQNSILMLLRAPLPFYQAMSNLTESEQEYLLDFHSKLIKKSKHDSKGVVRVRLTDSSKPARILSKLTPPKNRNDRRPRFVACLIDKNFDEPGKIEFHIGIGALTMFTMFLLGFDRDHLDEKAMRAELAVREVIEYSGKWKVVESNTEVIKDDGEVITEIDVVAQSNLEPERWLTCEVKDFSFWRGWIFGHGSEARKQYYEEAVDKLPVKEAFIRETHDIEDLESIIVTSIPEPYNYINGVPLVYLSDLSEHLVKITSDDYTPRKHYQSSNFLIRYFTRLQSDYQSADKLDKPIESLQEDISAFKEKAAKIKEDYERVRDTYHSIVSEYDTLAVSEKLARKRLLMDTGENHYQLEAELKNIRLKKSKMARERKVRANVLRKLKKRYKEQLDKIKEKESEIAKLNASKERLITPRLF